MEEFLELAFRHVELGIAGAQIEQFADGSLTLFAGEAFGRVLALLRSENTHPYFLGVFVCRPEMQEAFEISRLAHHGRGDGAVDSDVMSADVGEDSIVGGGSAANVVLGRKAVDAYGNGEASIRGPAFWQGTESAGDNLHMKVALEKPGEQGFELAIAHERISADEREMKRLILVDDAEDAFDKFSATIVRKIAESCGRISKVPIEIGIASGTTKWTLARDLDGETGDAAFQDTAPRPQYVRNFHDTPLSNLLILDGWKAGLRCKFVLEV